MSHTISGHMPRVSSLSLPIGTSGVAVSNELAQIAARLHTAQGADLARCAALLSLSVALFTSAGLTGTPTGDALMGLQRDCVASWLQGKGVCPNGLDGALLAFAQAAETARYLDGLPD